MATEAATAQRRIPRARPFRVPINLSGTLFLLGLVAIWQIAVSTHLLKSRFLPEPTKIASAIASLTASGALPSNMGHTLYVTLLGWAAAGLLSFVIGVVLGLSSVAWRYSMASIEFLRALPGISFVPVAVLLLGFSVKMELVVVVYVSLWPVLVNTVHGVRRVTPLHNDVAKMLRMSALTRVRRFVLPTAAPYLLVGMQVSLAISFALALVAEMVGNPAGAGQALVVAQNTLQPANMFAYIVVVGIVGVALNAALMRAAAMWLPGTTSQGRPEAI